MRRIRIQISEQEQADKEARVLKHPGAPGATDDGDEDGMGDGAANHWASGGRWPSDHWGGEGGMSVWVQANYWVTGSGATRVSGGGRCWAGVRQTAGRRRRACRAGECLERLECLESNGFGNIAYLHA